MKYLKILIIVSTLFVNYASKSQTWDGTQTEIAETINWYFEGLLNYDPDMLRKAFFPDATISTVREGRQYSYTSLSFEYWLQFTKGQKPADPDKYINRILLIDYVGNQAMVKAELDWPKIKYVDYLSLMKIEGTWRILNKIWYEEGK